MVIIHGMIDTHKIASDFQAAIKSLLTEGYFTYHSKKNFNTGKATISQVLDEIEPEEPDAKLYHKYTKHFKNFKFKWLNPGARRWAFLYTGIKGMKLVIKINRPICDIVGELGGYGNNVELDFYEAMKSNPVILGLCVPVLATFPLDSRIVVVSEFMYVMNEDPPLKVDKLVDENYKINRDREMFIKELFADSHNSNCAYSSKGIVYCTDFDREIVGLVEAKLSSLKKEMLDVYIRIGKHLHIPTDTLKSLP